MAPPSRLERILRRFKHTDDVADGVESEVKPKSSAETATVNSGDTLPQSPLPSIEVKDESLLKDTNPTQDDQIDPWPRAFEIFQERNHEKPIMASYKSHLSSLQGSERDTGSDILSRNSVQAAVNKLLEDQEKRQWKITIGNHDIKIRRQVEKLVKFVHWSDGFVKSAVGTQPYAALAWSGVSLIVQISISGLSKNDEMLKGFNAILDLQVYWQLFEQKCLDRDHRDHYRPMFEQVAKFYSYVIEYQAQVLHHLGRSQPSRLWTYLQGSSSWSESMKNINDLDQSCQKLLLVIESSELRKYRENGLESLHQIRDVDKSILQHMLKRGEDKLERDLLEELAIVAGNYGESKDRNPKRVTGTCEWFLKDEQFARWNSSNSSDLLWVTANPGCGKSVLSKSLVDEGHLNPDTTFIITSDSVKSTPEPVVAYFFFKQGGEGKMDGAQALCALLHQIFISRSTSSAIQHALSFHKLHGTTLTSKFSELWDILILSAANLKDNEIICVLDALDECVPESAECLLGKLESFYSDAETCSKSKLKFLITSRPTSQLSYGFGIFPDNAAYVHLDGDGKHEQICQEIDLFIDAKVESLAGKFQNRRNVEKIRARLKSMENRTYLWLYLTLDYINKDPAKYSRPADIEELLSNLPDNVSGFYEKMLCEKKNDRRTEILLQLVLASERPLTLMEASIALTTALRKGCIDSHQCVMDEMWSPGAFEDVVKDYCGLFISIHDSKLSFIHQTARDFLTENAKQQGKYSYWEGRFRSQQAHRTMSQVCLDYLLIPDICGPIDEYGFIHQFYEKEYPFLHYSANNWPSHLAHCWDDLLDADIDRVRILCDPYGRFIQTWTFAYEDFESFVHNLSDWSSLGVAAYVGLDKFASLLLKDGADVNGGQDKPLQLAADQGHEAMVRMLLENGADSRLLSANYSPPLICALSNGHDRVVQLILDHQVQSHGQIQSSEPLLVEAAETGNERILKTLLKYGADVNVKSEDGTTALQAAALRGHQMIVEILLDHGANVNAPSGFWGTALHAAARSNSLKVLETLLRHEAEVDLEGGLYGTALQAAIAGENQQMFDLLVECGASIHIQSGDHGTALQAASVIENKKIFDFLLHRTINVDIQGGFYGTALQAAAANGRHDKVGRLLKHGANVNLQNQNGRTALYWASEDGHQHIVEMLLNHGADLKLQRLNGDVALHAASGAGHQYIVQMLLSHGANVNLQDSEGGTALHEASKSGHEHVVEILLSHGADVSLTRSSSTALYDAAREGHDKVVEVLLNHGADVNTPCPYRPALYSAAENGHDKVVEILLNHGADIKGAKVHKTALDEAAEKGHDKVVEVLLNHGAYTNATGIGETAFSKASYNGHVKIVEMLLDHEADSKFEEYGGTALLEAVRGWQQTVVELLVDRGADVNTLEDFRGPLHIAAETGHPKIVEILLNHGADPHHIDFLDKTTPLYEAAKNGHQRVVEILLNHDRGLDSDAALQIATENEYMSIVGMLETYARAGAN